MKSPVGAYFAVMNSISIQSLATDRPQRGPALMLRFLALVLIVGFCLFDQPRMRAAANGEPIAMNSIGEQLPRAETIRICVACLAKHGDFDIPAGDGGDFVAPRIARIDGAGTRPQPPSRQAAHAFTSPPDTLPRAPPAANRA